MARAHSHVERGRAIADGGPSTSLRARYNARYTGRSAQTFEEVELGEIARVGIDVSFAVLIDMQGT